LIGAIIPSREGGASVCGTIRFKNGENLSFSSESDDSKILHQKLETLCQFIATFYGTNVVHRKDARPSEKRDKKNKCKKHAKKDDHR
jgi:hypothetical protein